MTNKEKAERLRAILRENQEGGGPALYATGTRDQTLQRVFDVRVQEGTLEGLVGGIWSEITSWETR
jgi:hypothetical protein